MTYSINTNMTSILPINFFNFILSFLMLILFSSCTSIDHKENNTERILVTHQELKKIWPESRIVGQKITGIRFTRLNKLDGTIEGYAVGARDFGVWDIDGDKVCHHFTKWRSGVRECLTIYRKGSHYEAYTLDGNYWASFRLTPL